jgi:hypothetical protein
MPASGTSPRAALLAAARAGARAPTHRVLYFFLPPEADADADADARAWRPAASQHGPLESLTSEASSPCAPAGIFYRRT